MKIEAKDWSRGEGEYLNRRSMLTPPPRELIEAIRTVGLDPHGYSPETQTVSAVKAALLAGVSGEVLPLVANLDAKTGDAVGTHVYFDVEDGRVFDEIKPMLREIAHRRSLTLGEDSFLRGLCKIAGRLSIPLPFFALREDLAADAAAKGLPSTAYILALLRDPEAEKGKRLALEREAFAAGCRSQRLLSDLAREGDDVLAPLGEVDAAEARLIAALRSGDRRHLREVANSDDASLEQVNEALEALHERSVETLSDLARAMEIAMPCRDYGVSLAGASAGFAMETLLAQSPRHRWIGCFVSPAWPAAESTKAALRASTASTSLRFDWLGVSRGDITYAEMAVPDRQVSADSLKSLQAVEALGRAHPNDLRWIDALVQLRRDMGQQVPEAELFKKLWPFRKRNGEFLRRGAGDNKDVEMVAQILRDIAAARPEDPPPVASWAEDEGRPADEAKPAMQEFARTELSRCTTDWHRNVVSWRAKSWGLDEVAADLDKGLLNSDDQAARWEAVYRLMEGHSPTKLDDLRSQAAWSGWSAVHRRELLRNIVEAALEAKDDACVLETLDELWRRFPLDPDEPSSGLCLQLRIKFRAIEDPRLGELLCPKSSLPGASLWMVYYAACAKRPGNDRERDQRILDRLAEAGLYRGTVDPPPPPILKDGDGLASCRRILAGPEGMQEQYKCLGLVSQLLQAGKDQEACACLDALAEHCVAVETRDESQFHGYLSDTCYYFPWDGAMHRIPESAVVVLQLRYTCGSLFQQGLKLDETVHRLLAHRLLAASNGSSDPMVRDLLRLMAARDCSDALREEERVPILHLLFREGSVTKVRQWAYQELVRDAPRCAAARESLVETLLAQFERIDSPPAKEVGRWEARFSSDEARTREAATDELRSHGRTVVPLLRALLQTTNPEIRARARQLLEEAADAQSDSR